MNHGERDIGYGVKIGEHRFGDFIAVKFHEDLDGTVERAVFVVNSLIRQVARTLKHERPEELFAIEVLESLKFKWENPNVLKEFDEQGNYKRR